ncbi:hypothetical protein [Oceanobacillus massiliensis]|uniref:hypothetical protein n=1 Tax=Oceanobacillus massiliensis TaxID=1465765 RepID=UPI0002880371|nr:hypothetical protein [Oceanobacillus massiliensis]
MDWIFDNMFIIAIIVSGLIGFFKNNNNDEQQKKNEKKRPVPRNPKPQAPFESSEKRAAERSVNRERQTPAVTRFEQRQKRSNRAAIAEIWRYFGY